MRRPRWTTAWYAVLIAASAVSGGCGLLQKNAADAEDDPAVETDAVDEDLRFVDASGKKDIVKSKDAVGVKDVAKDDAQDAAGVVDIAPSADVKVSPDAKAAKDTAAADGTGDTGPPVCTPAEVSACADTNPCTDDVCDVVFGCNHIYNQSACDDGSACTVGDTCTDGTCGGSAISCDDGKACTADTCKSSFGCVHANALGACDDGNICTTGESCKAGVCIGGSPADCGDGIACTLDTCDPATGCLHSSGDGPCDDGNDCTVGETCAGGICSGGSPALCDDGSTCTTDSCDPPTGCTFTSVEGPCDDSDPCSGPDACQAGSCVAAPLVCPAADLCHSAGVCNAKTGTCNPVNKPDGAPCSDGVACTSGDTCSGGACVGVNQCDDDDVCTLDACGKTGVCSHTPGCTVGGTVSGLTGTGLKLVSGTHILAVVQNGTFVFPGGFGDGDNYFATLATAPDFPAQHCAIRQGSGSIHGGNVADIAVTCAQCGDGAVGEDPVTQVEFDWLGNTNTPAPEFMDCWANGKQILHVDAATAEWYCDTLIHHVAVADALGLAAIVAGDNTLSCQFAQNLAWIVATARHASGRGDQVVIYDSPNDPGGLMDGVRRNSACPGYTTAPGLVSASLPIALTEACDDGNLDEGDGCSSLCRVEDCTTGMDTDLDGLDDCYETATGVFVDQTHTGTSAQLWDTDGDGLGDGDELLGTPGGLDLAALGATPLRQDVFVEADWMNDNAECQLHTHQIEPGAEAMAVQMFAQAPHLNPDGTTGIALHIDYGQGSKWLGGNNAGNAIEFPPDIGVDLANVKAANFAAKRLGYFHYALMMHSLGPTAGGIGELTGDDFIVASGGCDVCYKCKGTDIPGHVQIEAFCHELGHNLGLGHGGDSACNGKANYPSIMNYRHAYEGIDVDCDDLPDGTLDYSRGDRVVLDESALDEANGVCGGFWIDWNNDGAVTAKVQKDLNGSFNNTCDGNTFSQMTDHDDWGALSFSGVTSGVTPSAGGERKAMICYDDPVSVVKRQQR